MKQGKLLSTGIVIFIVLILVIIFSNATFITIEASERGVLFRRFTGGLDKANIYTPGFHMLAPWNTIYVYDVREQQIEESMEVLSRNGLTITVDVTVRINPMHKKIGDLHEKFGTGFIESLVRPEVRSSVRKIIGRFAPEELYSTKRDEVQQLIHDELEKVLTNNYIELRATLIRGIELPEKVRAAIESKIEAEQSSLKYVYVLQQERQEAERKIIEARAKAESNQILNASLSANILKDKGIEATLKLANSANSKVIIVGGNGDGLPLILGGN